MRQNASNFDVIQTLSRSLAPACVLVFAFGCQTPGVGDPCTPEQVPPDGFQSSESYLETSSVQCRTRVCMVYQFEGNPTRTREDCELNPMGEVCGLLPSRNEVSERVYCTCRCRPPSDSNIPGCECPEGFQCREDLLTLGGAGIRGGYCVKSSTLVDSQ